VLFGASLVVSAIVFYCVLRLFCQDKEDDEQDTSRFVLGPWSNDDNAKGVSAPPLLPLQELQPPESGDGHALQSNSGEGDRPPQRRACMLARSRASVCDFFNSVRRFELVLFLSYHVVLCQMVCLLQLIDYIMLPILFFTTLYIFV
jgi:hypothetical protein